MYGKAFASMWVGSMMGAGAEVFALWSYCLACKTRDGFIELNPKFLSAVIGCSEEKITSAIEYLSAPDPESRTKECKGRRMVHEGAFLYRIVNAEAYTRIQKEEHLREYYREQKRKQRERENVPENRRECPKTIGHVDVDVDVDTDVDTNVDTSMARDEPKVSRRKKASSKPEYSQMFNEFWGKSWKRGHKRAAWDSLVAMDLADQEMADVVIGDWTQAFERRPANMRPHVSTWLNNRGWEDDLSAELAKAKDDVRQVGKTQPPPVTDNGRKKAVRCIQTQTIHLLELEINNDQAAKIVRAAAKEFGRLSDAKIEPRDMAIQFGSIHDQMLTDLFPTLPEEIVEKTDPPKDGYQGAEAWERGKNAHRRIAAREFYGIRDINDYNWGE